MSNQEAYEGMCEKAEKYDKLKEAIQSKISKISSGNKSHTWNRTGCVHSICKGFGGTCMTDEEVIKTQKWLHENHFLFSSTFEDVQASTEIAIKAIKDRTKLRKAIRKIKKEVKGAAKTIKAGYGNYETIIDIIEKHTEGLI